MKKIRKVFSEYWVTICIYLGLFMLYKYVSDNALVSPFLFPTVSKIQKAFVENKELMLINMVHSFQLLLPSIFISLIVALVIGIIVGLNKKIRKAVSPVIYTFSVVPSILLSPFALLLAPNFKTASIFLIVYGTLWSTLFATITGIVTIDKRYLDKARTLELKGVKKMTKVILPAASPSIIGGFVNSLRSSFVMLVYAEMYGSKYGMGYFVKKYSEFGLYSETWGGFIFMVIVLLVVMQIFEKLKDYMLRWTI